MPSTPITMTFLPALRDTRLQPPSQYEPAAVAALAAAVRFRKARRFILDFEDSGMKNHHAKFVFVSPPHPTPG